MVAIQTVTRAGSGPREKARGVAGRTSGPGSEIFGVGSGISARENGGEEGILWSPGKLPAFSGESAGGSQIRTGTGKMLFGFHGADGAAAGGGVAAGATGVAGAESVGFSFSRRLLSAGSGLVSAPDLASEPAADLLSVGLHPTKLAMAMNARG